MQTNLLFSAPVLYDGLRFAGDPFYVQCAEHFKHLEDCADLKVCVPSDSTLYAFVEEALPVRRIVAVEPKGDLLGFFNGDCNVIVTKQVVPSDLVLRNMGFRGNFTLGSKMFSHESWSLVVSNDDVRWADFVNAVVQSLLVAEGYNITKATADSFPQTSVFGEHYKNMFRHSVSVVGSLRELYETHLTHIPQRKYVNKINNGSSGLMLSYPFGELTPREADSAMGPLLQKVLARGKLLCGVRLHRPGFALQTDDGRSSGMEIELCRAMATSLFADADSFELVPLDSPGDGFQKLVAGEADVITGAVWNLENDVREPTTGNGFAFSQPYFYGQDENNLCLATLEDDSDWAAYSFWLISALIYAEEKGINQTAFNSMPEVMLYGPTLKRMLRDAVMAVGNYGEMYKRTLESIIPRSGRNELNVNGQGPQLYPMPGLM